MDVSLFLVLFDWSVLCTFPSISKVSALELMGQGFPGGALVKNLPANAGDMGSSPGLGRSHMPWSS